MKKLIRVAPLMVFLFIAKVNIGRAQAINDHMFPAAASAKSSIDYDARGFIINGKRTFLVSAGLEYARIPHQLWYDRLMRIKRDGFNCIEIYTFWNYHEPKDDQFDFSGNHDLDAFLKLVKRLNMYAIVRVGPYYCAEWDFGGYPIWLRFKDELEVRKPNAVFEKYVDRFFDHLIPVVSKNQINHGGSVILVQLENEHKEGWGTVTPNDYFKHLKNKALSLGIQVPYFFSGLHHGSNPAGEAPSFDDVQRPNPWFTTEFWSVWFTVYGSGQKDADSFGRRTWKVIAHGGNGYNFYMAHGGTNFGYTNDNEDAASYDYGAAVGQTGDLRPIYYQFKRNGLFARTFENILENSLDAGQAYKSFVSDTALKVNGRHSNSGDIIFVDNPGKKEVSTQININNALLPLNGKIVLAPGEIFPVVHNYKISSGVKLDWSVARILGASKQGNTTTLVIYGDAATPGYLKFSTPGTAKILEGKGAFKLKGKSLALNVVFNAEKPVSYTFSSQNQVIRILAVNTKLADRTWFEEIKGKNYVITGPEYIDRSALVNNKVLLKTEHFWEEKQVYPTWIFGEGLSKTAAKSTASEFQHEESIPFDAAWQVKKASAPADANFDDSSWLKSKGAPQMGADGDLTADAWYRTSVNVTDAGLYILKVKEGGDRATVFVDNVRAASGSLHNNELRLDLAAGKHQLVVFTAHDGRDKLFDYMGPVNKIGAKGLADDVILQKSIKGEAVTGWKTKPTDRVDFRSRPVALTDANDYKTGDDAFDGHPGFAWFQTQIMYKAGHVPSTLDFGSIDDNAVVFINDKRVVRQEGHNVAFSISLEGLLKPDTINTLSLLIQNTDGSGGINKPVELVYDDNVSIALSGWSMKGGPGDPYAVAGWKTLGVTDSFEGPVFFKNTFAVKSLNTNSTGMYRVSFEGLGHGSVWVNGYNIGRYPEKIPVKSMYIPECWLQKTGNTIVVYDEDGRTPGKIGINAEKVASRDVQTVKF